MAAKTPVRALIHTWSMSTTPTLVDTGAAHLATGIPPALLRSWLHRGKITGHGRDRKGRDLVDLDEVQNHARTRIT